MFFSLPYLATVFVLILIQAMAAVPWVTTVFANRTLTLGEILRESFLPRTLLRVLVVGVVLAVVSLGLGQDRTTLETVGMWAGFLFQLQLIVDFFLLGFPLLMKVWPKGGAVAFAAFREGVRQPMFWVLFIFAFLALVVSLVVPYFTFGEDLVMVKDLGFDTMMLAAALFGAIAASQSISEEIEGRTAVTLMSKPVSRRQFLLGKFLGILLASLLMFALLGWVFEGLIPTKSWLDRLDPVPNPAWLTSTLASFNLPDPATDLLRGVGLWVDQTLQVLPGLVMTFSEVTVLLAVAVALATRTTMVVNLATVLAIYFLANVTPVLVQIGDEATAAAKAAHRVDAGAELLSFTAGLFNILLPDLDAFRIGPALVADIAVPAPYVLSVLFYGMLYTLIVLLLGLVLFEDRDLA
ncbi:MAG TPA: ABC transporter permease [Gemmataceae bacterium]|nr:ABC transporter permease [Gemmataceae bacterium]